MSLSNIMYHEFTNDTFMVRLLALSEGFVSSSFPTVSLATRINSLKHFSVEDALKIVQGREAAEVAPVA